MSWTVKVLLGGFLWILSSTIFVSGVWANTVKAASCNTTDVQNAINSAATASTVIIPGGTCTWTSGVTISGKGIAVQGSGSGRIIAVSSSPQTLATGSKTFTVTGADPGKALSISTGQTLNVTETNNRTNAMSGTVTSFGGNTLVMNITSASGSCALVAYPSIPEVNCGRWLISTAPTTVLINNSSSTLFAVTEDSTFHTSLSGFKIAQGTGSGHGIDFIAGGGQAIILHDCWIEQGSGDSIHSNVSRGVVSRCSFDSTPFSMAPIAFHFQPYDQTAWSLPSYFGTNDPDGQHNFYVEDSDFHAYLNATDNDEGARTVFRYNLMNNAGFGTHGADTGPFGSRYFEFYNNVGIFNGYSNLTTFPMNWWMFVRGGTFVIYNNTLPNLQSTDFGTKPAVNMTVMNLQRNSAPLPCWGANYTTSGQYYPAPHQVGLGYVTGKGIANYPLDGVTNSTSYPLTSLGYPPQYVGDSEPGYIWGNSSAPLSTSITDYGSSQQNSCSGATYDHSSSYIQLGRDYFNSSTAKPGYTPYTYPHPLMAGLSSGNGPASPTSLTAIVQ